LGHCGGAGPSVGQGVETNPQALKGRFAKAVNPSGIGARADGISLEQRKTIGPVNDYPENSKNLQDLLAGLRLNINTDGPAELTSITMREAVEHYKIHEFADCGGGGKAYSTRSRKTQVLNRWVLPHWGKLELRAIKTVAVEQWLRTLVTEKSSETRPLAGGTKEKIRDAMSSVYNHAHRRTCGPGSTGLVRGDPV